MPLFRRKAHDAAPAVTLQVNEIQSVNGGTG